MSYILVIWTIVGYANTHEKYDWRPIGEFRSVAACQHASRVLNVANRSMCIPTDTKKEQP